uniref:Uncharacterized protein n=1 Tax=Anguilla anguilla TaxID=7936 RepID=A0A0E9XFN5_ANGAN
MQYRRLPTGKHACTSTAHYTLTIIPQKRFCLHTHREALCTHPHRTQLTTSLEWPTTWHTLTLLGEQLCPSWTHTVYTPQPANAQHITNKPKYRGAPSTVMQCWWGTATK